jgi:hypothetical protein
MLDAAQAHEQANSEMSRHRTASRGSIKTI